MCNFIFFSRQTLHIVRIFIFTGYEQQQKMLQKHSN